MGCKAVIAACPLLKACRGMLSPRSRRFWLSFFALCVSQYANVQCAAESHLCAFQCFDFFLFFC